MALLRALRSLSAFVLLAAAFVLAGLLQRVFVWPLVTLWPRALPPIMDAFMHRMSAVVLGLVVFGGARARRTGTVPTDGPVLILMNHQSLIDIPTAILMCWPHVPLFVARRRYARGIPMVSLMLRIRADPLVEPEADARGALRALAEAARRQRHGLLVFPEGHRTEHGEVDEFATAGLKVMLRGRRVPVWLVVTDGFQGCRTIGDFVFNMHEVDGRTEVLGPYEAPAEDGEIRAFTERMREEMIAHLRSWRQADDAGA
ncbi:MAG TPA: 1-acyl-sn-glycerol-3-phosphate acyltransferase [Vicinamibacteria bacterium]|jgi:1-acyl-sn-glycerol-3-phosphate acyltransferase|nr:1-acyl-sn-glycerol-3-phosphate acyltransferase [Vicinamibacteria bacterium]